MPLHLPSRTFVVGLQAGHSAPIFNSYDRRSFFGAFVARVEPLAMLSKGSSVGSMRYEGFVLSTQGERAGSRDRTMGYGALWGFRFEGSSGVFGEINTGLVSFTQSLPGVPLRVEFSPTIALGYRFPRSRYEAGIRLTHISNWNRQRPNNGLNLVAAYVGFVF